MMQWVQLADMKSWRMQPDKSIGYSVCALAIGVFVAIQIPIPNMRNKMLKIAYRAPIADSRKWAIYYTTNLMFKTYFKVRSLCAKS